MIKYWTGIGARGVYTNGRESLPLPDGIKELQINIGYTMASKGYTLLSGGAGGSDTNFHQGVCNRDSALAEIWLPYKNFKKDLRPVNDQGSTYIPVTKDQITTAGDYYVFHNIRDDFFDMQYYNQQFHGRNKHQIFSDQAHAVSTVCNYAAPEKGGRVSGGTRSAVEVARLEGVPTYNLFIKEQRERLCTLLGITYTPIPEVDDLNYY